MVNGTPKIRNFPRGEPEPESTVLVTITRLPSHHSHIGRPSLDLSDELIQIKLLVWERIIMDWDEGFRVNESSCIGGFPNTHSIFPTDGQYGNVRAVEVPNNGHVSENPFSIPHPLYPTCAPHSP